MDHFRIAKCDLEGYQPHKSADAKEPPKNPYKEWSKPNLKCNCTDAFNRAWHEEQCIKEDKNHLELSEYCIKRHLHYQEWVCPVHGYKKR